MAQREIIETSQGELRFELEWFDGNARQFGPAYGGLSVYVGNFPVWSARSERKLNKGLRASWVDLLEHLSRYWLYIILEQGYPFNVSPRWPSDLDDPLLARWENASDEIQRREEELVYAFKLCHNLAQATPGSLRPDLWIVRDGGVFIVESVVGGRSITEYIAATEIKRVLSELGDAIAKRLSSASDPRSMEAVASWHDRYLADSFTEACIATGLPESYLHEIAGLGESVCDLVHDSNASWAGDNVFLDVTYRCKGVVSPNRMRALLQEVRTCAGKVPTELEAISSSILEELSRAKALWSRPFQEGHALAEWLRAYQENPSGRIEPEQILANWGVSVREYDLEVDSLDAVAFWAHGECPSVLWNSSAKHRQNEGARRATLAHEICHLLVDRTSTLPLSAVVGGAMDKRLEQRANAFAAELLCPRREAGIEYRSDRNVRLSVRRLTQRYGVSDELAVLQLARSGETFDFAAKQEIQQFGPRGAVYPW